MGYIQDIRKFIGHRAILGCAAGAIILDSFGRVLLQRRSDNGLWDNPGGSMELGEEIEDTLKREVYEETGLRISNPYFFKIYSGESLHIIYPNQDEVYYLTVVYIVREYHGVLKSLDGESIELKFYSWDELPKNLTNQVHVILNDLHQENIL